MEALAPTSRMQLDPVKLAQWVQRRTRTQQQFQCIPYYAFEYTQISENKCTITYALTSGIETTLLM